MSGAIATSSALPVLEYAQGDALATETWRWRILRCVAMLPAVVVPFLSFTFDMSPAEAIGIGFREMVIDGSPDGYHWLLVLAIGLAWPMPVWLWACRLLLPLRTGVNECRVLISLAAMLAISGVAFAGWGVSVNLHDGNTLDAREWSAFAAGPVIVAAVSPLLLLRRRTFDPVRLVLIVHALAYLSVAVIALLGFADNRDPGWWLTVWLCGWSLAEILSAVLPVRHHG